MNTSSLLEYDWPYMLTFLPGEAELEKTARMYKAITRKRNVDSAATLLRLALAYGYCGMSLRQTAAWAQAANVAVLSDVALMKRLRAAAPWLGHLLGIKLAERAPPPRIPTFHGRTRLVDATCLCHPGSRGTNWRLHMGFDLSTLTIDHIELTDHTGGETLKRFGFVPGDLIIGDRGYAHRAGLHAVVSAKADFLIRLNWVTVPLLDLSGKRFDLLEALRGLEDCTPGDFPVLVAPFTQKRIPPIPARLLAVRKTEVAAETARRTVMKERSRKGRALDPRTLEAAGYIFVLTSVPAHRFCAAEGLELYRFRWQIELAFKRLKSLLELDHLPAKDPPLARSIIYAKLLAALLVDDLTKQFLDFSPWGYRLASKTTITLAYPASVGG